MDIVLNNYDLVYKICDNLDYQNASAVGLVNRCFNEVSKDLYPVKWRCEIEEPFHRDVMPNIKHMICNYNPITFLTNAEIRNMFINILDSFFHPYIRSTLFAAIIKGTLYDLRISIASIV